MVGPKRRAFLCGSVALLALAATPTQAASPSAPIETVVVSAPRFELLAREKQKLAPNLINVQAAETIIKYPDFNAAESLSRMPGISLLSDTGEGRFVIIRGLDSNLGGATYGGVVLLNTNSGGTYNSQSGRAVEFDTIPDGAIDGIIVTKTGTPDHDAEGLGGTVELTPRTAANITKPFVEVTVGGGYEPIHNHAGPFNAELAFGARFGFKDGAPVIENGQSANDVEPGWISNPTPFSFVVDGSYREDRRGFDDIEEDYTTSTSFNPAGPLDKAFADLQLRQYNYHRRRFGYGGEFDFKPNDDHRYYLRANVFGYVESVIKNRLEYDGLDGTTGFSIAVDPANPKGIATQSSITLHGTNEEETHRNSVFAAGGEDDFDIVKLDYRVAYSRATFFINRDYGTDFNGPSPVNVTYDNITSPNFPVLKITDGTNPNDPTLYTLTNLNNDMENDADQEWSYAGNATVPLARVSDTSRLKFGFEVRLRNKVARHQVEGFASVPSLALSSLSPLAPYTSFYHGRFTNGPGINQPAIVDQITNGAFASTGFTPDDTGFFNADEYVYAGYIMYTGQFGPWGILAGARVENTHAKYGFFKFDQNGNELGFERDPHNYTDFFPTLQARYAFSDDLVARATYSTGIGRPGFLQVAKPITIDFSANTITEGNPNLQPTTGDNIDLDLEYYLDEGGVAQLGAFDKEFRNYIFTRGHDVPSDPRLFTPPGVPVHIVTFDNIPSAYARGLEAAYVQKFTFLPQPFSGFGLDTNITYVGSSGAVRPGENDSLPGTSPITYNAALFYEDFGLDVRLAAQYVGHSLYQVKDSRAGDQFEDSRFTLDFTSSYAFCDNWVWYFNVRNLTNAPLRIYQGFPNWPIQREFYDQTYESGIRAKF